MSSEDILATWRVLRRRLWLIILLVIVTVGTILLFQYTADPRYRASVRFQITDPPRGDVILYDGFRTSALREEIPYIKGNFINVLTSGSVARQVIARLGLQDISIEEVISNIETEDIEDSDFTRVTVYANSPQLAADLANGLMDEALRQYGQLRAGTATASKEFIGAELEASQQDLEKAQEALIEFKIENRVGSLSGMVFEQQELISDLRMRRDDARAAEDLAEAASYDELIAQREAELQDLVRLSIEHDALEANVEQAQETYDFLLEKQTEAKLTENEVMAVGYIQLLGEAHPPAGAVSPYNYKLLAMGLIVSLAVGVVLAFVWAFIESAPETEKKRGDGPVQGAAEASKS